MQSCSDVALLPEECVVVADPGSGALKIFDGEGVFQKVLVSPVHPICVTASRSGLVVFTQKDNKYSNSVGLCMMDGQKVGEWGKDKFTKPHAIAFTNGGRLAISDVHMYSQNPVALYTQNGKFIRKCHTDHCDPPLKSPLFIDVDVYDRIAVTDSAAHCIHVFDREGNYFFKIGSKGKEHGRFRCPQGVTSDAKGNFIVCDSANKRVSVFSSSGRFIEDLLTEDDGLDSPSSIDYNRSGRLVVANNVSRSGMFTKLNAFDVV